MAFDLDEAITLLRRTPPTVRSLLCDLPETWLSATEGPDTWHPRDVLAHMTDLEETDWMVRVRWIRAFGVTKPFESIDRVRFRGELPGYSLPQLLDLFAERRARNLAELSSLHLDGAQLDLKGTHPALGDVTLRQLLASWVVHDLTHLVQISRVMAHRYDNEVGPWKEFLSVLKERRTSIVDC